MSIFSIAASEMLAHVAEETSAVSGCFLAGKSGLNLKKVCFDEIPHTYEEVGKHLTSSAIRGVCGIICMNPVSLAAAAAELGISAITCYRTIQGEGRADFNSFLCDASRRVDRMLQGKGLGL